MIDKLKKKLSLIIILIVLGILILVNLFIIADFRNNYNEYLEYKSKIFDNSISQVFHTYEQFSDFVFEREVNTEEVKTIFSKAGKAKTEEKEVLRNELYYHFEELYGLLTRYNFSQFHFHFPDGESFLRVHYPERYGDYLFPIRESVRIANEEEHFVSGFEEGRIYSGYRYVYPLNYQGEHIGTVEVSISVESVQKDLYNYNLTNSDIGFIIKKDIIDKAVFEDMLSNYKESVVSNEYYIENAILEVMENNENALGIYKEEKFIEILRKETKDEMKSGKSFSKELKYKDGYYLVQLSAISNVSGENVGYFISISSDEEIGILIRNTNLWILFSVIIIIITTWMSVFLIKKQVEIQNLAMVDQLTKIYNRRFFFEMSEKELKKSLRDQSEICVAMIDIDQFKKVNDTYGHIQGDAVLQSIAKLMKEEIRQKDILARFGGEEFILLMPQTKVIEAESMLDRIRVKVEEHDFSPVDTVTISIGFTKINNLKRLEKSINKADEALYMAKNYGRNKVMQYSKNK